MLDLLIEGATVVDGTGKAGRVDPVGVEDGRLLVGERARGAAARRRVDATGLVLCPGFIDVHTHFDAQVFWDPFLTPSSLHGVTTVVAGNCGFSIAPLDERGCRLHDAAAGPGRGDPPGRAPRGRAVELAAPSASISTP